ncbi:MAG TPA: DUF4340 domain-containing protein [Planctomycetota bacterium]|nr:DUF4340 domain-containing protein [Planctomycetota bacterium]
MKTNLILLVLALLLAVPTTLTLKSERARFTEIEDLPLLFEGFDPRTVAGVSIAKGWREPGDAQQQQQQEDQQQKQVAELQMQVGAGGKWVLMNTDLAGAPVRRQKVFDEVLEHLARIRRDEKAVHRAKATPEELKQYGLTKDEGVLVVAFDRQGRVLAELVIGKEVGGAAQWESTTVRGRYVRARSNDAVIVYETDFFAPSVEATDWLDTRIYQADLSKTVGFELFNVTTDKPVSFVKERPELAEWQADQAPPDTGAPRQGELQTLVQKLSLVDAARFLAPLQPEVLKAKGLDPAKIGLDPPECAVTYRLEGGETIVLHVGRKLEDRPEAYARSNQCNFLFTVPDWLKADLEVRVKNLYDPPAEALRDGEDKKDEKDKEDKEDDGEAGNGREPGKSGK